MSDGLPDMVSRLDADTIRPIPWHPGVAYAIGDIDNPDGSRSTVAPRGVLRSVLDRYDALGLTPICGPELEFYFAHRPDGVWQRIINKTGRVYMTGSLVDPDGHFLHLLRMLDQLNIGAFAGNHEFSPSQYEINLWHSEALDAADSLAHFRDQFYIDDDDVCYLDGNSLGRLPFGTVSAVGEFMNDEWGAEVVDGWSHWVDEAGTVGDVLAAVALGTGPGHAP
jgi:hypothetical protein